MEIYMVNTLSDNIPFSIKRLAVSACCSIGFLNSFINAAFFAYGSLTKQRQIPARAPVRKHFCFPGIRATHSRRNCPPPGSDAPCASGSGILRPQAAPPGSAVLRSRRPAGR